jgi:hypothetical protein
MFKKSVIAATLLGLSAYASAASYSLVSTPTPAKAVDGTFLTITFNSLVADSNAQLNFTLQGFGSVDGFENGWDDVFTLVINKKDYYAGFFDLGGGAGASNQWSPNLGTPVVNSEYHNGGTATFSNVIFDLKQGTNTFVFRYTPFGKLNGHHGQGFNDESWSIKNATIAAVPEPESYAMLIAGLGLIGAVARRRAQK